jgi:protein TonB
MTRPVDILDERDRLRNPFYVSCALHGLAALGLVISGWVNLRPHEVFGDPNASGGNSVAVSPVARIPILAPDGPRNPLANDTASQVPAPVKPEPKQAARPIEDAIPLPSKKAPKQKAPPPGRYIPPKEPPRPLADNQLTTSGGARAVSPIFAPVPGGGGVGLGPAAPFGTRFGAYGLLIQDRVARAWRTEDVDARIRSAPIAIVTFELFRNGTVRNITVIQRSGLVALDNSAIRAITQASPFPPLPAGYERDSAVIEFWFQLKR